MDNKIDSIFNRLFNFKIDSAIILSLITAFAYFCAFLYEYTYCSYFNIPPELISIDFNTLLTFWSITGFLVFCATATFSIGYVTIKRLEKNYLLYNFLKYNFIFTLSSSVSLLAIPIYTINWKNYLIVFVVLNLLCLITYYLSKRRRNRIQKEINDINEFHQK